MKLIHWGELAYLDHVRNWLGLKYNNLTGLILTVHLRLFWPLSILRPLVVNFLLLTEAFYGVFYGGGGEANTISNPILGRHSLHVINNAPILSLWNQTDYWLEWWSGCPNLGYCNTHDVQENPTSPKNSQQPRCIFKFFLDKFRNCGISHSIMTTIKKSSWLISLLSGRKSLQILTRKWFISVSATDVESNFETSWAY